VFSTCICLYIQWTTVKIPIVLFTQEDGSWVDIFSQPHLREMWGLLRKATIFYLRHYEEHVDMASEDVKAAFVAASKQAAKDLWDYSVLAEQHFGHLLCKKNMHKLNCELPRQQEQRGHAAYQAEY
jgi:hypothetical protein